jgi:hypothetical protein
MEEHLHEYFVVPEAVRSLPFMVFVVEVRPAHRASLGAITHVDGTARVQSVSRAGDEHYYRLIDRVRERTGTPMVLNTSFNNHVEPIVNTPEDVLNCFLSTRLDALLIGNYLVTKRSDGASPDVVTRLVPRLSHRYAMVRGPAHDGDGDAHRLRLRLHDRYRDRYQPISVAAHDALVHATERRVALGEPLAALAPSERPVVVDELQALWDERVFVGVSAR